jgi:ATP-dependent DNA helicase RecG
MPAGPDPRTVLQRALVLERQQGFADRAAVGGITSFARMQLDRAGPGATAGLRHAVEALDGYAGADRRAREAAVAVALRALLTGAVPAAASVRSAEPTPAPGARVTPPTPAVVPKPSRPRPPLRIVHRAEDLETPLTALKGMRRQMSDALAHLGVVTVRDLLHYFPRTHYDYTDTRSISRLRTGRKTTLVGTIADVRTNRTGRGIAITTAAIQDDTGTIAVRWFNQPYLAKQLPVGARIAITGEPDVFNSRITFTPRDFELVQSEDLLHSARLVPIYPLTRGLFQKSLRALIKRVVDEYAAAVDDFLDSALRDRLELPVLSEAIAAYHFPTDEHERAKAERRLAFDELLLIQIGLLQRKRRWQVPVPGSEIPTDEVVLERYCASLPFDLTPAQRRVIAEILEDMGVPIPMNRLLQGDVGSGKTAVAAAALLQAVQAGRQAVVMAPTEILAEQHFATLSRLLQPFECRIAMLVGSTKAAQRRAILPAVAAGEVDIVVGTHALIQEGVAFHDLRLAVTDEQHRFGVEQRATLRDKGLHPHVLSMTATPIPRTLAMTIYGDLDVSVVDEMPPGRLPAITTWVRNPSDAYGVIRDEVERGHQAFVICPVIEESADSDMRSVIAEYKELQSLVFPDLEVGLLHGRMKSAEKDRILQKFRDGAFHVLVATSVVEVGIDIPNATAMVIRDAERFGLAQLHQFRGRVGRGGDQAFCVLLSNSEGDAARERLEALTATDDGFTLAEEDLRLRGPGEFWGTRQSGLPELHVAQLGDVETVSLARRSAVELLREDPELTDPANADLRAQVERFWADAADLS